MTLDPTRELYQRVILDHSKNPRHRGQTSPVDRCQKGHISTCGDTVEITLAIDAATGAIADIKFSGNGCALSMASSDLMAEAIAGKTPAQALAIVDQFEAMLRGETEFSVDLRRLNAMKIVAAMPVRIKCAMLPWHTLKVAIGE